MAASTFLLFSSSLIRARKPFFLSFSSSPFPAATFPLLPPSTRLIPTAPPLSLSIRLPNPIPDPNGLLSTDDIETVVGSGCSNLLWKPVNSAKRLRAHVQLDEGDVCSACNLRGSCDRAYVTLKEAEATARTVDIVRLLLSYALDPLVISEEGKLPGRERIDASARNPLSDLTKLSDTSCNAELLKSLAKAPPSHWQ
ncbi:Glutathione S-transferase family protein isoform 1 [Hibiscus syriacus]|uniref:Glutathione S-transferase family protein isoform 1 n=1 Tax=Hibiscus syriacus TaxID=106335 RepID=A0A6A3BUI3_HIBSY|nr:Glutathione S-transferase family protein isoform 1 [Hibiscus syriacus]